MVPKPVHWHADEPHMFPHASKTVERHPEEKTRYRRVREEVRVRRTARVHKANVER